MNGKGQCMKVGQLVSTVRVPLEHKNDSVALSCFASAYGTNKVRT